MRGTALSLSMTLAGLTLLTASTAMAESYTTRIEPNQFYAATESIEHGVRVIRPMPTTRHVIVNPGGRTPLSLGFNDTRVYQQSRNYHYYDGPTATSDDSGGGGVYVGGIGGRRGHFLRGYSGGGGSGLGHRGGHGHGHGKGRH